MPPSARNYYSIFFLLSSDFCLPLSASLFSGLRAEAGCLPGRGSGLRRDERPDELCSVLYRLGINCQG